MSLFFKKKKETKDLGRVGTILALGLLVVILVTSALLRWQRAQMDKGFVRIGDDILLRVDVASTPATWEQGLSGRESLAEGEGMLFIFPQASRFAFWMKEMLFPIDIIWIMDGEIADITVDIPFPEPGVALLRYFPRVPVDTVLEVPAGFSARHGLKIGLPVEFLVDSGVPLR